MSTRKIKDAVEHGTKELIYFKGHAKATYMSDGSTVEDTINNIESKIDLSDYVTTDELEGYAKIEAIPSLEGYVKNTDLPDFDEFAKTEDIPSLNGYAKQSWVESQGYAHQEDLLEISFNDIQDSPISIDDSGMINFVDESGNVGFQINEEGLRVTDVIAGDHKLSQKANVSDIPSLDGYAKTEDIPSVDGFVKTEDLPNFDEFAKEEDIPSLYGYATQQWVNEQEFAHQGDLLNMSFNDIQDSPIIENNDGEVNIVDDNGNIALKVNDEGIYVKDVIAGDHILSQKVGLNSLKTINGESIIGDGDITIGGSDVYVTDFCIDDLHQIISEIEESIHIDAEGIINAVNENKVISIPINRENSRGGYIAHVEDYEDYINFYVNYDIFSLSFWIDKIEVTNELNGENITFIELQSYLVSGESIKTINGEEILGSGDFELATKEEMNVKADDSSVVHKEGDEDITGTKTFRNSVKFLQTGDNAIILGTDTRMSISDTNNTVLGLTRGSFTVGNQSYPLYIFGQEERPKYNNNEMAMLSDVEAKQDALISGTNIKTINGESILGSGDITISGGSSNGSGAYAEVNHGTSDTTFALTPNTFHVWDEVPSLTLTLGSETAGVANEYLFQFTSGAATTLSLPSDLKWANDSTPTIEPNMIYQVSILKGLASVLEFKNTQISIFYIDGTEYQMDEGMTWEEWVNSKYNIAGFYIEYLPWIDTYTIGIGADMDYGTIPGISKSDLILSGYEYEIYYENK